MRNDTAAASLAELTEPQRQQAMARLAVLRPTLEDGVPLIRAAADGNCPICSPACAVVGHTKTEEEHFDGRWIVDPATGCWSWTGHIGGNGYAYLRQDGKEMLAHRVAFRRANGFLPAHLLVCHDCDNPRCVRPDHLFLGDQAANMRDATEKGRTSRGSDRPGSKLTEADVAQARAEHHTPEMLAARFGLHRMTAARILSGRSWRHVAQPPHPDRRRARPKPCICTEAA